MITTASPGNNLRKAPKLGISRSRDPNTAAPFLFLPAGSPVPWAFPSGISQSESQSPRCYNLKRAFPLGGGSRGPTPLHPQLSRSSSHTAGAHQHPGLPTPDPAPGSACLRSCTEGGLATHGARIHVFLFLHFLFWVYHLQEKNSYQVRKRLPNWQAGPPGLPQRGGPPDVAQTPEAE